MLRFSVRRAFGLALGHLCIGLGHLAFGSGLGHLD